MSLYSTVNKILSIARKQPDVFEAGEGDIYEALNGRMNVAYPLVWITQQMHPQDMAVNSDCTTYSFSIFYVDRLTSDKSNRLQIQSHAIEVLQNIEKELELETEIPSKNYVTFTERFESLCAGAYIELTIYDFDDDNCVETFAPPALQYVYYHTLNGKPINIFEQSGWGGIPVFNRVISERDYTYHGENYRVNGELVFYGDMTHVPDNGFYVGGSPQDVGDIDAIYVPDTLTILGMNAFSSNESLYTIGSTENLVEIGSQAFQGTNISETFEFGSKTQKVGYKVFDNVRNFPDNSVKANMLLSQWGDVEKDTDPSWNMGSNILCVECLNGTTCDPDTGYTFTFLNEQGDVLPSSSTQYTVSWESNYPSIDYKFYDWRGDVLQFGNTDTSGITLNFSANTDSSRTLEYLFIAIDPSTDENIDALYWYLSPASDTGTTFNFINPDSEVLPSGTTAYTVTWETDLENVTYVVTDGQRQVVSSGTTSDSGVTVTFPENTGSTIAQYTIIAMDGNGKVMGQLDWYVLGNVARDWRPDSGGTHGYADEYLTLDIISGGTVSFTGGLDWDGTKAYYSKDSGNTWVEITSTPHGEPTPLFEVEAGERVHFYSDVYIDYHRIRTDAIYNVEGNIDSLVNGGRVFFENTNVVSAENLVLPSVLHKNHLAFLFHKCRMLVVPPQLPATIMAPKCYYGMFSWCDTLENAPALPATTLAESCYDAMFMNCPSLIQAPDLNATTLVDGCYDSMFFKCGSLNYVKCLAENHSGGGSETHKWLYNVAENGTFVKSASAEWRRGDSGIPENWIIETDSNNI